ncbi:MAG: preprotein translocase subunit SecG [Schleiferiaceae bacterium]|nr:preprotein translocase subunit SecG [Schleiferiaceae bacterium]
MTTLFVVLIALVSILLILVIMVQNPKGGGLSSAFGGGGTQMLGGVQKSTDLLDRATWALSIALLVLVLAVNMFNGPETLNPIDRETLTEEAADLLPRNTQQAPAGTPIEATEMPSAIEE